MTGILHLIEYDLDEIDQQKGVFFPHWVDEGLCQIETLLEKYRVFHENYGA